MSITIPQSCAVHPGEILREEYLRPLDLTAYRAFLVSHRPQPNALILCFYRNFYLKTGSHFSEIALAKFFQTSVQYWLNMQNIHDIQTVSEQIHHEVAFIRPCDAIYSKCT